MRKAGLFFLLAVVTWIHGGQARAQTAFDLPSGNKVVLHDLTTFYPLTGDKRKILRANLGIPGEKEFSREQLSVLADEFFMFYFGPYAQQKEYKSASVSFSKTKLKMGPFSTSTSENFLYVQQENGVWQPQHDSLVDDDPIPEAKALDLPSGSRIFVEFAGPTYLHQFRRKGWGSDYWSRTSFRSDPQAVYAQTREYWNLIKDKVDPSLGTAAIFAFDRPLLGFFHFRRHMFVVLQADEKGEWPQLPLSLDEAMGEKSRLVEASFGPQSLKTVWPER